MVNVEIKNLVVDFETLQQDSDDTVKRRAIDDVSLDINAGDFICILGKNGSGKSTLAKCLNALVTPSSGHVKIYGLDTSEENNINEIRKKVGISFQNPDNQIVASIVEEDVAFGLENIGIPTEEMQKRIDYSLNALGILDLKNKLTHKLSGGQKQKVSIAGIIAMESKIIILDEPTSMIDKKGRIDLLNTVKKLNVENNITIILISHFVEEIAYANRVLIMSDGKILYDKPPKEILLMKDELYNAGLELPYIPKLASELKSCGLKLNGNEDTIEELCQFLK